MPLQELPPDVLKMLAKYAASPRLVAHLTIVHDVAITLLEQIDASWPLLHYERESVLIGAATHDVGKTVYPDELIGPGSQHEEIGPQLLRESGFPENHARFAHTHGQWEREAAVQLEDILVAFADTIWKGKRNEALEQALALQIAEQCQQEVWEVYMKLDDIACELAKEAHERIIWQGKYQL
ncbi:HD domain-containing protein [Ktedonosporobacter rubrisoli]|uniref:HD domain-containing protein n=1 Tax=Ktedonosporobacter rubrisoli TaxID=2509675 RepID=A0A4P6JV93_KTERU|nr:HD domain-containing protein [Ktedonosporobacter rubrisoli]QBD79250.1 HD domain-containing protein [Ktedonosporobacter rubrisoli]